MKIQSLLRSIPRGWHSKSLNFQFLTPVLLILLTFGLCESDGATLRFEKVGDHCYYLRPSAGGDNVAAVVTGEGILIVDPPSGPDLPLTVEALKRLSPKPVRWVVFSNPRSARSEGARLFAEQGAVLLGGTQLYKLAESMPGADANKGTPGGEAVNLTSFAWLTFDRQVRLFPSNVEIRISALQHKARTGGDMVVFVPEDKVLFAGALYEAARYPDIDAPAQGNAGEWVDALKEVVESIPVLKPAIPQAKPAPAKPVPAKPVKEEPEKEKTLEEGIAVVSARGEVSNLQNMKDLLSACQKLHADIERAVKGGRTCESFLASPRADTYRSYANLDSFALQMCEAIRD